MKEGDWVLYKCVLCRKEYIIVKVYVNYLEFKFYVMWVVSLNVFFDVGIVVFMIIVYLWEKYFVNFSFRVF